MIRPGDIIRARYLNSVETRLRRARPRAGPGIVVVAGAGGTTISLAGVRDDILPVIVTRDAGSDPDWPSAITYRVEGHGLETQHGVQPTFNRPCREDEAKIHPQPDGTPALLVRWNDVEGTRLWGLMVLDERIAVRLCGAGA